MGSLCPLSHLAVSFEARVELVEEFAGSVR
jgi:hypothetical protein